MADSFSKKEKIKKKLQKQKEKAERREDRKTNNNKGKDLEDMLVYVDYLGNLTDIPPDQQEKEREKTKQPKNQTTEFKGIITFISEKGFGFITEEGTKENVFIHSNDVGFPLQKGELISYQKEENAKGIRAVKVQKIQ
ncbi:MULTISPECIES: cold-shock protein [Myroides]|uniref:Cold shock domain-containing protein n=1 Tax=Myroides albus TaxID=2562892 RepID=A0A6I3LN26_9FLAO|nr:MULTISPECIES: cold shock domain-containing protein [Myroides]MTG98720.1 cold shock domain-containing protein [Myroides albus]MVX37135.1 cold shock domain-containing protein [Myroides sp. LoEW2-1]UVD79081.1 cold shock domain-containing protein [Myroides albus]